MRHRFRRDAAVSGLAAKEQEMRCLVQRVASADVKIGSRTAGSIGPGLVAFVCAMRGDDENAVAAVARKLVNLRIFRDQNGKMNRSLLGSGGSALIVSQFTLAADTSRGNRPGFSDAAPPDLGQQRYLQFTDEVRSYGVHVATGEFGAEMRVTLTNDGPVTIWLDSDSAAWGSRRMHSRKA